MKYKSFLITGGTGSFGKAFVKHLIRTNKNIKRLVIFSRDEWKQSEMAKELNWKAEAEAQQAAIDAKLVRAMADGNGPTHHVGAIIDFVANHFVTRLPLEPCQGCQKMLLPDDPSKAAQVFSKDNKNRARRVYCSHWWHHKCLNKCWIVKLVKCPFCVLNK